MARRLAAALLFALVVLVALPPGAPTWERRAPSGWSELSARRRWLQGEVAAGRAPTVVLGDSVFGSPHLPEEQGPVARMRALAYAGSGAHFVDWTWPGALPLDEERMVALIVEGIEGVRVVAQVSARGFSQERTGASHSVPLLGQSPPWWWDLPLAGAWNRRTTALRDGRLGLGPARELYERWSGAVGAWLGGAADLSADAAAVAAERTLRVRPHLREIDLGATSPQVAAMQRLCGSGIRVAVVLTPTLAALADLDQNALDAKLAGWVGSLHRGSDALVQGPEGARCQLHWLGGPELRALSFIDPIHVDAEGAMVLAAQVLEALRIDRAIPGPRASGERRGIVSSIGGIGLPGHHDGSTRVAQFLAPRDVAAVPGGPWLVADTGNHTIREVDADRGVVRTVFGEVGSPAWASPTALDTPIRVLPDGAGGVWTMSHRGQLRVLTPAGPERVKGDGSSSSLVVAPWDGFDASRSPVIGPSGVPGTILVADPKDMVIAVVSQTGERRDLLRWMGGGISAVAASAEGVLVADERGCLHHRAAGQEGAGPLDLQGDSPLVPCGSEASAAFWRGLGDPLDVSPLPLESAAIERAVRLFVVDAPPPGAGEGPLYYVEDGASWARALWVIDPTNGTAWPFWPASRDGLRFSAAELYKGAIPAADHRGTVLWLDPRTGVLTRWDRRVAVARWHYERGGAYAIADPLHPALRLGLFGSSLPGAARGGFESSWASLAASLDEQLRKEASLVSVDVEVVSRCTPGQRLIHAVTGLRGAPEGDLDVAALTLDRSTFLELTESAARASWDDDRCPVAAAEGPVAKPIWGGQGLRLDPALPARPQVLDALLRCWVAEGKRRGIPLVAIDLLPLDDDDHRGLSAPRRDDPEITFVRDRLRAAGVLWIDPRPRIAADLSALWPINHKDDHHFNTRGHLALAHAVAPELIPLLRERGRDMFGQGLSTRPAPTRVADLRSYGDLDARFGVAASAITTWADERRAGVTVDLSARPDLAGAAPEALARVAMWAALVAQDRLAPDRDIEVRLLLSFDRDEYGQRRGLSSKALGIYGVDAADRPRLEELLPVLEQDSAIRPGFFRAR